LCRKSRGKSKSAAESAGSCMGGVYELFIESWFSAAHRLCGYPGVCSKLHGHNWKVETRVACRELDDLGMGLDFHELKTLVAEATADLDHATLNELDAFRDVNPTAENIARHIYLAVAAKLPQDRRLALVSVTIVESPGLAALYRED
jgi:6-pyruvoyltetrahydropterin/6-carboxytetrahydropterin synthase